MTGNWTRPFGLILASALLAGLGAAPAGADAGHDEDTQRDMIEEMKKMHGEHEHAHDFQAMEGMSREDMRRVMGAMIDIGLALPPMNSHRGREIFLEKGCIVCHSVAGVGGGIGPSLNAADMPEPMNAFEFAARMWRGAPAMVEFQSVELGYVIDLTADDIANIAAFAASRAEQKLLQDGDIPEPLRDSILDERYWEMEDWSDFMADGQEGYVTPAPADAAGEAQPPASEQPE